MWLYEEKEMNEVPDNAFGFVYIITNLLSGRKYIGKKLFTKSKIRTVKGVRKRTRTDSDWREYYGSNKELLHDVSTLGPEHFRRDVVHICFNRGQCSYFEAKLQFEMGALENPKMFYNEWIMCKIHRKHLKL